jgi:hypothetical protein
MECPYCGAELVKEDVYGFLCSHQSGEILGDILRCPNHEGFETEEEARNYNEGSGDYSEEEDWEEMCCGSCCHYVSGSFYTDEHGNLHEGYPC